MMAHLAPSVAAIIRLNVVGLRLDSGAATTADWIAPCHHASICQNCSKSIPCTTDLLDIREQMLDSETLKLLPPHGGLPPVTTLSAPTHHEANADHVAATFGCWATAVRLSPSCSLECCRVMWVEKAPVTRSKPQEASPQSLLRGFFSSQQHSVTVPNRETATVSRRPLGRTRQI